MGTLVRQLRTHANLPAFAALAIDNQLSSKLIFDMDDAPDTTGAVSAQTVGGQLRDYNDKPFKAQVVFELKLYADFDRTTLAQSPSSVRGTFPAVGPTTEGEILARSSSGAVVQVKTSLTGGIRLPITLTAGGFPSTLFIVGAEIDGSPDMNNTDFDSVTFGP